LKIYVFVLTALFLCSPSWAKYGVFDLNLVGNTYYAVAQGINDKCQIVGYCSTSATDDTVQIPFIWDEINGLRVLPGGYGDAKSISTNVVCGYLKKKGWIATMWSASSRQILSATPLNLPSLGGSQSCLLSCSSGGKLVGWTTDVSQNKKACTWITNQTNIHVETSLVCTPNDDGTYHLGYTTSSSYDPATYICKPIGPSTIGYEATSVIGTERSWGGFGNAIVAGKNASGQGFLVLNNQHYPLNVYPSCNPQNDIFQLLLDSSASFTGINEMESLCGQVGNVGSERAFLQENEVRTLIPLFNGDVKSFATGINDQISKNVCFFDPLAAETRGINVLNYQHAVQVVGYSFDSLNRNHAFIWTKGGNCVYLPDLGGGESWAYGVNDVGEVCGASKDSSGIVRAVLWRQIDDEADPPRMMSSAGKSTGLQVGHVHILNGLVISNTLSDYSGCFSYIQIPEVLSAVKVIGPYGLTKREIVEFEGTLKRECGEFTLYPEMTLFARANGEIPSPFAFSNRSIVDTSIGSGPPYSGRAKIWGKVLDISYFPDYQRLLINDGSNFILQDSYPVFDGDGNLAYDENGQTIMVPPVIGIFVCLPRTIPVSIGESYVFTGVKGNLMYNKLVPILWDAEIQ